MESKSRWPMRRTWQFANHGNQPELRSTTDLRHVRALCVLGAAGLGKTFEMGVLEAQDRAMGLDVRSARLAEYARDGRGITIALDALVDGVTHQSVVYLDALDEAMIAEQMVVLPLIGWIRTSLAKARPSFRLSCRGAVWPPRVSEALREVYGDDVGVASLEPLSVADYEAAARASGVNPESFLQAVEAASASALARHPLTLRMMLSVFKKDHTLPTRQNDLFHRGVQVLVREPAERRDCGTVPDVDDCEMLEAAQHVACLLVLSGHDAVNDGEGALATGMAADELASLPHAGKPLRKNTLKALALSALCEGRDGGGFRFAHRQIAEYLAGRRLARLLPHQAIALLANDLGRGVGVAGPLRETASFAANESVEVADWIADRDPEVIGLSDVASDDVRRRATLNLLGKFRRRELTDSQVGRDGAGYEGLNYPNAEMDLSPVLRERGPHAEDVLAFAIEVVEAWALTGLSDDLAKLMLDPSAPERARVDAGYALRQMGTDAAKHSLKPLILAGVDDPQWQLKGLALRCNWPENLGTQELLSALDRSPNLSFHGAYEGFLLDLDREGFCAGDARVSGLNWATSLLRGGRDFDYLDRIVMRIAHAAVEELANPEIAGALAELLMAVARQHTDSPLRPISALGAIRDPNLPPESGAPLNSRMRERRLLIDALAVRVIDAEHFWWDAYRTPGLVVLDDFGWLLDRALDSARPMTARHQYAELARLMFNWEDPLCCELWLAAREHEPVCSILNFPLFIELGSETARNLKRQHDQMVAMARKRERRSLRPPPAERVSIMLQKCEQEDFRFWGGLCRELTLGDESASYEFERFVSRSHGWKRADEATQARLLACAKQFLEQDTESLEAAEAEPLNHMLTAGMMAVWLVAELDHGWLKTRECTWWEAWSWYMLREMHLNMHKEEPEPKQALFAMLMEQVPVAVMDRLMRLAQAADTESRLLLVSLLELMEKVVSSDVDQKLCGMIAAREVSSDRIDEVAAFVLKRSPEQAQQVCVAALARGVPESESDLTGRLCVALLVEGGSDARRAVLELLADRCDLASYVLGSFAQIERPHRRDENTSRGPSSWEPALAGSLVSLLLTCFPPENDPPNEGMRYIGPEESARDLRDQLITHLGSIATAEAVAVLRKLEMEFGDRYPWLRRPRARAERQFRLSRWSPTPARAVAEVLAGEAKRLIRSPSDALDAIVASLERYQRDLQSGTTRAVEDLWNTPTGQPPTPKIEERVSDKIRDAIKWYLEKYGVFAEREVQVSRRLIRTDAGGKRGSEVDVFVRLQTATPNGRDPIAVPIEVKRSDNKESKTGMRDQLADRYMVQADTDVGVFVVAWLTAPGMSRYFTPKWDTIEAARAELTEQVNAIKLERGVDVRAVVLEASLS